MKNSTLCEQFLLISFELSQKVMKNYSSKFSKKTYRQSQLLALLIFKRYNHWTYRQTQEQISFNPRISQVLGLRKIPDYSTLHKFYTRVDEKILEKVFQLLLKELKRTLSGRRDAIGDSTGYRLTNAGPHYVASSWHQDKITAFRGRKPCRPYLKHTLLIDEKTILIFGQHVSWGPASDTRELKPAMKTKPSWFRIKRLAMDRGFDSLKNHRYIHCNLKARSVIRIGNRVSKRTPSQFRRWLWQYFPRVFYRKRAKAEGCISVMKRKFSNYVLTRIPNLRHSEILMLGIVYNLYRGIQLGLLLLFFIEF